MSTKNTTIVPTATQHKGKTRTRSKKFENLVGPTDPKVDNEAREKLITARVGLYLKHSFFGNLATRMRMINADEWCTTAATDGNVLYYNSRFIMMLKTKEVEFLLAHEIGHCIYDHMDRRDRRHPELWNIAGDYAINADLKRHKVGEFITTVPCLYEAKYDGMASEAIYDDLMKNVQKINIDDLLDKMIDDHLDSSEEGEGSVSGDQGDGDGDDKKGKGRPKLSQEERDRIRQEMKQAMIQAALSQEAGTLPAGIERMIKQMTAPVMPWRELIQTNLTSAIRSNYSWMRPSRRGWHMDAVLPGLLPGEEIDVVVFIDLSGSISMKQGQDFLSEVAGMMEAFDGFKIRVACFDTEVYNMQEFSSENLDTIDGYKMQGGGGTDFMCMFEYLKEEGIVPNRMIVFTDGMPCGNWCPDEDDFEITWIIHGSKSITPPRGQWAYYDDHQK